MNSLNPEDGVSISQWGFVYMIARVKGAQGGRRWSDQRRRIHLAKLSKGKCGQDGRTGENQTRLLLTTKEHNEGIHGGFPYRENGACGNL